MSQTETKKTISLLQQYITTLQHQNHAKYGQITLLYTQITSIKQQNQILRSFIEKMRIKWDEQRKQLNDKLDAKNQEICNESRNFGQELRNSVDINSLKLVAQDMRQEIQTKDIEIAKIVKENKSLSTLLIKIKEQLTETTYKAIKSEEKVRNQLQIIKQFENELYGLKNSKIQQRATSFAKVDVEKLIRQNNQLIQRVRCLEKQKNGYYQQLKMTSPLKIKQSKENGKSIQKKGNWKSQKWNVIEQKLKVIRNENEQLKANLAII